MSSVNVIKVPDEISKKLFGDKYSNSSGANEQTLPKIKFVLKEGKDKKTSSKTNRKNHSRTRIQRDVFSNDPEVGRIKTVPVRELKKLYKIQKKLGEGGFGAAYLAKHIPSGETVVLKKSLEKVPFWTNALQAAEDEVMFLKSFTTDKKCHPNIICYYDAFIDKASIEKDKRSISASCKKRSTNEFHKKGTFCIVMEQIKGKDLLDLTDDGHLTDELIWYMAEDLLVGLNAIHCKGMLHNDIKPENILFDVELEEVRYIDFGFACFRGGGNECEAATEEYHAPEVDEDGFGKIDERTDVYALGKTITMMATKNNFDPEDIDRDRAKKHIKDKKLRDLCTDMLRENRNSRMYADDLLRKHFGYTFQRK